MPEGPRCDLVLPPRRDRITPLGSTGLRAWAPAKINLNLLVGLRKADGYHPIDSLVVKITLYDEITLHRREDGQIRFTSRGIECGDDEKNLALRAAKLLASTGRGCGQSLGAGITLTKHIPVGKGLGGGSSDAAAVLRGLNELWECGMSEGELASLGGGLGSDVALFLGPAASRITGRGQCVEAITVYPFVAVLLVPEFSCSTPEVYRVFDAKPPVKHRPLETALLQEPPSRWRDSLRNQLQRPAIRVAPQLGELLDSVGRCVSVPVCLTGSGSAMFWVCDHQREAATVLRQLPADLKPKCIIAQGSAW